MNIIFDYSGTLSEDFQHVYKTVMKIFEYFGKNQESHEWFKENFKYPYIKFYKENSINNDKKELDKLFNQFMNEVVKDLGEPKLINGVKEVITKLKDKHKLFLLTGVPKTFLTNNLDSQKISDYFNGYSSNVSDKIDGLCKLMEKCTLNPKDTVYVGDMPNDIIAGRMNGVTTIAIVSKESYSEEEKLKSENPDFLIHDIMELLFLNLR